MKADDPKDRHHLENTIQDLLAEDRFCFYMEVDETDTKDIFSDDESEIK